jgi:UDP-N-acetylmuramyl pentapeptide phosphotransferase/UDP-N-acetylglucosamine-1-phosphate transferase
LAWAKVIKPQTSKTGKEAPPPTLSGVPTMSAFYVAWPFAVEMVPVCAAAICAVLVMPLIIRASCYSEKKRVCAGPQNIHIEPTTRLGGAAVFLAYVVAVMLALKLEHMPLRSALLLLISALPVVVVGLWEDIARRVSPKQRLLAAVGSAALATAIAQGVITRLDLPLVDGWLAYLPFAVPLTWFMVAGACNAINLIDGNHGLAGGTAVLMFFGMAMVAGRAGDELVLLQALAMIGALAGFLLWNYPHGRVFLGDGGAYFIGFMYAQLSIQLITRNAGVSAWFVIALTAYPIVETLFSMYRRKIVRHAASMQPDTQHLHSLLYHHFLLLGRRTGRSWRWRGHHFAEQRRYGDRRARLLQGPFLSIERRVPVRRANARVAPRLWLLHSSLCLVIALIFHGDTAALIGFTIVYAIYYIVCYRKAVRLSAPYPISRQALDQVEPVAIIRDGVRQETGKVHVVIDAEADATRLAGIDTLLGGGGNDTIMAELAQTSCPAVSATTSYLSPNQAGCEPRVPPARETETISNRAPS